MGADQSFRAEVRSDVKFHRPQPEMANGVLLTILEAWLGLGTIYKIDFIDCNVCHGRSGTIDTKRVSKIALRGSDDDRDDEGTDSYIRSPSVK